MFIHFRVDKMTSVFTTVALVLFLIIEGIHRYISSIILLFVTFRTSEFI